MHAAAVPQLWQLSAWRRTAASRAAFSPETGEAKRSAFVEVKKAGLRPGAGGGGRRRRGRGRRGAGRGRRWRPSSTPVAASPAGTEKLLAPRPGGALPGRLEGGSPARAAPSPRCRSWAAGGGGGGAGGGAEGQGPGRCGGRAQERLLAAGALLFSQLSPLVLGQKLGALEPCHPRRRGGPHQTVPRRLGPAGREALRSK